MIQNDPKIRLALYVATALVTSVAIVLGHVGPVDWADAARELATYLGGIASLAAATNLSPAASAAPRHIKE